MKKLGMLALMVWGVAHAASPVEKGPIHEAFLQQVDGGTVLRAVAKKPPKDVVEGKPDQTDPQSEWIRGYWAWDDVDKRYVWMSGVWRRPPPGHEWISGYWKEFDQGWAWIRGIWSATAEEDLTYIGDPPPDPIDEGAGDSMGPKFWMSGYWSYDDSARSYSWVKGSWAALDPDWVLVPAHYEWRPEGYLFIPAYWDWPIDYRGTAYSPVFAKGGESYTPTEVLGPNTIVRRLVAYYPNYVCFYFHHYYYHWNWWISWWGTPPWWSWSGWWSFGWQAQWGLWWWYCHPGFPHPFWLTGVIAAQIWPPAAALLGLMQGLWGLPFILTPNGIIPINQLLNAIGKDNLPILPAKKKKREAILDKVTPKKPEGESLRPNGDPPDRRSRLGSPGPRVDFGPPPSGIRELSPVAPPRMPGRTPPIQPGVTPQPVPPRPTTPTPPPSARPTPTYPRQPRPTPQRPVQPKPRPVGPQPTRPYPGKPEVRPQPPTRPMPSRPQPSQPGPSRTPPSEIGPRRTPPTQSQPRQTTPQPSRGTSRQFQPRQSPQRIQPQRVQPQGIQPQRTQPRQTGPSPRQTRPSKGGYY